MSRFAELGENKFTILMKLLSKPEIVKCLVSNEQNFLDVQLPDDFNIPSLIYSQIYPYKYIPTVQTEPNTFITMSFGYKPEGLMFKNGAICFYIITHNSLIRTSYGSLRYDNYIDEVFSESRELGIGKLPFYDMNDFPVNENYSGAYIAYKSTEFQF